MRHRTFALAMSALLLLYLVLVGWQAVRFLGTGVPVAQIMGVALLVLPVIGVWALVRELLFGLRSERLAATLGREGGLPPVPEGARPSGRVPRADADAQFPAFREEVEANPESWRAWFRLGLAYDASGDRRRARAAIRRAIELSRAG